MKCTLVNGTDEILNAMIFSTQFRSDKGSRYFQPEATDALAGSAIATTYLNRNPGKNIELELPDEFIKDGVPHVSLRKSVFSKKIAPIPDPLLLTGASFSRGGIMKFL